MSFSPTLGPCSPVAAYASRPYHFADPRGRVCRVPEPHGSLGFLDPVGGRRPVMGPDAGVVPWCFTRWEMIRSPARPCHTREPRAGTPRQPASGNPASMPDHPTRMLIGVGPCEESHPDRLTYLRTLVTRPEPTVRPPSRIAKVSVSSMAIGWISSTRISVLSPGMTISVPSGRCTTPVTSVVRK